MTTDISTNLMPSPHTTNSSTNLMPSPHTTNSSTNLMPSPHTTNSSTNLMPNPHTTNSSTNLMPSPHTTNSSTNLMPSPHTTNSSTNLMPSPHTTNSSTNLMPSPHTTNSSTNSLPSTHTTNSSTNLMPSPHTTNSSTNSLPSTHTTNSSTNLMPSPHTTNSSTNLMPSPHTTNSSANLLPSPHTTNSSANLLPSPHTTNSSANLLPSPHTTNSSANLMPSPGTTNSSANLLPSPHTTNSSANLLPSPHTTNSSANWLPSPHTTNSSANLLPSPGTNSSSQKLYQQQSELKPILSMEFECANCGKRAYNMKACTRCWWAKYCNRSCQGSHWGRHKMECRKDVTKSQYYKGGRAVEVAVALGQDQMEAFCDEAALFLNLEDCPKNGYNDHASFISVTDMTLDKLPIEIRRQDVLNYVMAESRMTVRVLVNWTSKNRPDGDPCARYRGSRSTRTASGNYVLDNAEHFVSKDCPIPNCHRAKDLGPQHTIYEGDLKIFTNKHVLYDDDELSRTVVDFFYDSPDRSGVIREYAIKLFYTKPSSDKTFFKVTIHDQELFDRLEKNHLDRAATFHSLSPLVVKSMCSFAFVISHPHGLPKKISIGRVLEVTQENVTEETMENARLAGQLERQWFESNREEDYGKYMACLGQKNLPVYKVMYDTPTCQGSSGAPVLFGGRECNGHWGPFMANHSAYDMDSNLNFMKIVMFA